MKLTARRLALWLLVILLALAPTLFGVDPGPRAATPNPSPAGRLLGPVSKLVAEVQWIRVQRAVLQGESELALARAETALSLDPDATTGWRFVAVHLGLDLASPSREPDPARRRELLSAGLEVLTRGERHADSPAELAFWRGILLLTHAETDPELGWPGGSSALWTRTAAAFEHAAELGAPAARELAEQARARAAKD